MNRNRIVGALKTVVGDFKVAVGNLRGDTKTVLKGRIEQTIGKAQNAVGRLKDAARGAGKAGWR